MPLSCHAGWLFPMPRAGTADSGSPTRHTPADTNTLSPPGTSEDVSGYETSIPFHYPGLRSSGKWVSEAAPRSHLQLFLGLVNI